MHTIIPVLMLRDLRMNQVIGEAASQSYQRTLKHLQHLPVKSSRQPQKLKTSGNRTKASFSAYRSATKGTGITLGVSYEE